MSTPKLFAFKNSTNLLKVKAVAKLAKFELEIHQVEVHIKPKDTYEESPTNTLPYLETSEGIISETTAIMLYIANKAGFAGSSDYEKAQINQWICFGLHELTFPKKAVVYPLFGYYPHDNEEAKTAQDRLKHLLKSLDKHLAGKSFLVGNSITVADFQVWADLKSYWQFVYVEQVRTKMYANIDAWFNRVSSTDAIKNTFGTVHTCKSALKAPKVEKKEEAKEEKKEKPKVVDDEPVEEEPKKKGEVFPESKMDFDAFKKAFMNSTDRKAVLDKFFAEEYDKNAFSIHYLRYQKLASEGKVLWQTQNGRDGFLERTESGRKHTFSTHGVYGEEGTLEIKGVWLWRGLDCPQFIIDNPQFEYYDRRTLDPSKPEEKEVIYNYWLNLKEGDVVDGLKVVDVVTFK